MTTPLHRLEGTTYWIIEDPASILDYINTEIRKEWESDARSKGRDPQQDTWLQTQKMKWNLEIVDIGKVKLDPCLMCYVDAKSGYRFAEELEKRSMELRRTIETHGSVIWPLIVREEGLGLVDGYCRYAVLKAMKVVKTFAYTGSL